MVLANKVKTLPAIELLFKVTLSNLPNSISCYKAIIFVILIKIPCPFRNVIIYTLSSE